MKDNFKTTIEYNSKQYMLSMIYISGMKIFEIMLFPMKDATVDSNEVFCYRTMFQESASHRIKDICDYPEKYLSDEAIEAYLACQKCGEWCCTLCKYFDIRTLQRI
jgi:hypothetical protein